MIKKIWKIITPVISAIIGIVAANHLNIFELLSFVPRDFTYEVCITAYFAIADVMLDALQELFSDKLQKSCFSKIEVIIGQPETNININTDAILTFNSDDLAEATVIVDIKGQKKHFQDIELIIKKPAFAELQGAPRRREVRLDSENYCIKLTDLFGNSERIECKQEFRIALIQDPVDGDTSVIIAPELSKKKWNISYKHNNAVLRAVRR